MVTPILITKYVRTSELEEKKMLFTRNLFYLTIILAFGTGTVSLAAVVEDFESFTPSALIDNDPPGSWMTAGTIASVFEGQGLYAEILEGEGTNFCRLSTGNPVPGYAYENVGRALLSLPEGQHVTEGAAWSFSVDVLAHGGNDVYGIVTIGLQDATGADDGSRLGLAVDFVDLASGGTYFGIKDLSSWAGDYLNAGFQTSYGYCEVLDGQFDRIILTYDPSMGDGNNIKLEVYDSDTLKDAVSGYYPVASFNFGNTWIGQGQGSEGGVRAATMDIDNIVIKNGYASSLEGDLNDDGFVGGDDLDIVRSFWGQNVPSGDLLSGDPSGDGFVGGDDLDIVRANWGQGMPPTPATVPEPSSFLLLLAVGICLMWTGYRQRKED